MKQSGKDIFDQKKKKNETTKKGKSTRNVYKVKNIQRKVEST